MTNKSISYLVKGGNALKGEVTPILNKNSLMGALPLAVLDNQYLRYQDLPNTSDVNRFLELLKNLGAEIIKENNLTTIYNKSVNSYEVDLNLGNKFRGAFSLAGALLSRFGEAKIPIPGGCKLGMRSISTHLSAYKDLGIKVNQLNDIIHFKKSKSIPKTHAIWLLEASVTATLNIATFIASSDMEVEIIGAASEPHVQDVLHTLKEMGAKIEGIGTHHLKIKGTTNLSPATFISSPDFVDIAGYIIAAAITKGEILIKNANIPQIMDGIIKWMELFNINIQRKDNDLLVKGNDELIIHKDFFPLAGKELPKFSVRPWPGFPVDVLPVMVILATKAKGSMVFQNWMYESGFDYIRELNYLGADIYMSDPQKIIVMDHIVKYIGGEVTAPRIIQGAKAIFLAALADKATSTLYGMNILNRRYPNILETYRSLGAEISVIN